MAQSPSHKFGQVIGNLLEEILLPELLRFCDERGLYLDRHGSRQAVRKGKKVAWEDRYGNSHDLDFVIEKNGSENVRGRPVAFIEAAWRRYTKHSRAKAQEIQGAVLPVAEKYERDAPFLGAVLAGHVTTPSLDQLRSQGFQIVYLPYETIIAAFRSVKIDARFDEKTPDAAFMRCVDQIAALPHGQRDRVKEAILASNRKAFEEFFAKLRRKLDRVPKRVVVLPLFGTPGDFETASEAMAFLRSFDCQQAAGAFHKYEVSVRFSNGDEIKGLVEDEREVERFLEYVTS
jgi:hypothetical protein